jgi:hypothetical protein
MVDFCEQKFLEPKKFVVPAQAGTQVRCAINESTTYELLPSREPRVFENFKKRVELHSSNSQPLPFVNSPHKLATYSA